MHGPMDVRWISGLRVTLADPEAAEAVPSTSALAEVCPQNVGTSFGPSRGLTMTSMAGAPDTAAALCMQATQACQHAAVRRPLLRLRDASVL